MQETNSLDRRMFERISVDVPLSFTELSSNREGIAAARDISATGISFVTDEKLQRYDSVEMWLKIPQKDDRLFTRGMVIWSAKHGVSQYKVGIKLEKPELMGMSAILRGMAQE